MVRVGVVWDRTVAFLWDRIGTLLPIAFATLVLPNAVTGALEPIRATAGPGLRGAIGLLLLALLLATAPLSWLAMVASAARMDMEGMRLAITGPQRGTIALLAIIYAALGLWIAARLSVLLPVVVAERLGLRAIPRAFRLTRGLGLKLAGVILLYALVLSIATYAAQTVFGSVLLLIAGGEGPVTVASVVTPLLVSCVAAAFSVLACVFLALLYRAVRGVREGGPWA